ncbi:MAG: hypothetical protein JWM86_1469 [Thermoleophilia bacterium]|nr:hypothetical protein [Thermoleophilia bacterium]
MSDSAPAWPAAPQPIDNPPPPPLGAVDPSAFAMPQPAGMPQPHQSPPQPDFAPPSPEGLAPMPAGMPFPGSMEAALDVGAPLMHAPSPAMPTQAMPTQAMPQYDAMPSYEAMPSGAMPNFEATVTAEPTVTFEPAVATEPGDAASGDAASGAAPAAWWSPGTALVVAMLALAWQLVSFYAREQFPKRESAGLPLDRFDTLFGSMPLVGTPVGAFVGMAFAVAAGIVLYIGHGRGVKEPVLQGAVATIAVLALAAPMLLMKVAG